MIKNRNEIPNVNKANKSGNIKFKITQSTFTAKKYSDYTNTPTSEFEINFCVDGWNPLDDIIPAIENAPSKRQKVYSYDYMYACYACTVWMRDMKEYNGTHFYVPPTGFELPMEFAL